MVRKRAKRCDQSRKRISSFYNKSSDYRVAPQSMLRKERKFQYRSGKYFAPSCRTKNIRTLYKVVDLFAEILLVA